MSTGEILAHGDFIQDFLKYAFKQTDLHDKGEIDGVPYGREILICPEPITFLGELDDFSGNQKACIAKFKEILSDQNRCPRVRLEKSPGAVWFNTTKNGINLRPGMETGQNLPRPVTMGDNAVHALMAGQTGSGKSVLLNNLIFNLLAEYPPWELDLYLADFKKVEFSRYMNKFATPHVSACAATGEIRYVISMIQYMVDCMNARESLFARLGVQKIADLRDSREFMDDFPEIVLPRMLLIVDEFQQMFLDASPKEGEQIRSMLTAIVKKGRATGLHILFASQEMSNTLSQSDLANFRIRFALNCNMGVSMSVIGNKEATTIRKGKVIYNTSDGSREDNKVYTVPFVDTNVKLGAQYSYFEEFLAQLREFASLYTFTKTQKFYQEDQQAPFLEKDAQESLDNGMRGGKYDRFLNKEKRLSLETILERIRPWREKVFCSNKYFEVLTLGDYVTFSNLRYDIQTLFLEYGRSKNILAVSPRMEDIAYLERLLAYNFRTSPREKVTGVPYQHIVYSFQPGVANLFALADEVGAKEVYTGPEDLDSLQMKLIKRKMLMQLCAQCETPYEFAMGNFRTYLEINRRMFSPSQAEKMEEEAAAAYEKIYGEISLADIPKAAKEVLKNDMANPMEKSTAQNLMTMYNYHQNEKAVFPPTVIWIVGIDGVERIPEWLMQEMKTGSDLDLLFIIMANAEFDQITQMAKCCDYFFLGGNNRRIYDRLQMDFTKRDADSIALDLNIRSTGENRSFKKYKCSFGRQKAPSIPFDEILRACAADI